MGKLIKFLALQKFRFDSGQTILAVVNFMLLLYVASSNLADKLNIDEFLIVVIGVPSAMLMVWLVGYIILKIGFRRAIIREYWKPGRLLKGWREKMEKIKECEGCRELRRNLGKLAICLLILFLMWVSYCYGLSNCLH